MYVIVRLLFAHPQLDNSHNSLEQTNFQTSQQLSEQEQYAIGTVKKEGKVLACKLPYDALLSIYRRGLVHFHVPIDSNDLFIGTVSIGGCKWISDKQFSHSSTIARLHHEQNHQ